MPQLSEVESYDHVLITPNSNYPRSFLTVSYKNSAAPKVKTTEKGSNHSFSPREKIKIDERTKETRENTKTNIVFLCIKSPAFLI